MKKIIDSLNKSSIGIPVLTFVIGAILPAYTLLISDKNWFGDLGNWLSAIGTIAAVGVSLYLASNDHKVKLQINMSSMNRLQTEHDIVFDVVNLGSRDTSVKMYIEVVDNLFTTKVESKSQRSNDESAPITKFEDLRNQAKKALVDSEGNFINPLEWVKVPAYGGISVGIDMGPLDTSLFLRQEVSSQTVFFVVENTDGVLLRRRLNSNKLVYVNNG